MTGTNAAGTVASYPSDTTAANNCILDAGGYNFQITNLSSTGIFRLTGQQAGAHSIASGGASAGIIEYYGTGGTAGTVFTDIVASAPNYYHLRINGSGLTDTFTLAGNITTAADVIINGGVLIAGAYQITVGGYWLNTATSASFTSGSGTVSFLPDVVYLPSGQAIHVTGDNIWWIFDCQAPGRTILFENDKTQTIASGGIFRVKSGGTAITLNRLTANGTPGNPPANPGDDIYFWFFDLTPGATFDMNNVLVYYSNARDDPISVRDVFLL
jgi:hypothetical protein